MLKRLVKEIMQARATPILKHMEGLIALRPISIAVQTHDACNASCVFCARRKIKATGETMSSELFEKICDDYSGLGGGHFGFSPLIADPLVDPLFLSRMEVLSKYENITPNIFTNAIAFSNFTDDQIINLLDVLHHIDISIGGLDRASYKTIYGVDKYDVVWDQLKRLAKLNSSKKQLKLHIRTNSKESILSSIKLDEIRSLGYETNDIIDTFSSWGGLITSKDLPDGSKIASFDNSDKTTPCFNPMFNVLILQNGMVTACSCMDAKGGFVVGDMKEGTILDAWKSQRMVEIRNSFQEGNLPKICRTCSFYKRFDSFYRNSGLKDYDPSKEFWSSLR